MKLLRCIFFGLISLSLCAGCAKKDNEKATSKSFQVPVEYFKLDNGLRVVLSEDHTAPTVVVAVYYNIGFRNEPKDRTGFAHLFEHMMFQGSANFPKGKFEQLTEHNGGFNNGSTRFDFTNYYEVMPAHMLEPILWAEADRMTALDLNEANLANQQGVVKNEVKVNVLNQPYGGFPWLDMPQYANENWYNAHNFYGDLNDLDSANLEDVKTFFETYYAPNNAVITIVGDFQPEDARKWIQKYFTHIPSRQLPALPDLTEPKQTVEKKFTKEDKLANRPAIAIAYKMPERNTAEYYAMGIIDQILVNGNDSKLFQKLVQEKGYTGEVEGGINYIGNMYNYNGPMIWMCNLLYDKTLSADSIIHQMDLAAAEVQNITPEEVEVAIIKIRSALYDNIGGSFGIGRADLLSCFALFDDDPSRINDIENEFRKITPEIVKKTANQFLIPSNRTILIIDPKATNL